MKKTPRAARPSPRRADVDLSQFAGHTVLGEPLALLSSALLRLQLGATRGGMTQITATWTAQEAEAFTRAMERVEGPVPNDTRTAGQRDADRFVAMAKEVGRAVAHLQRPPGTAV